MTDIMELYIKEYKPVPYTAKVQGTAFVHEAIGSMVDILHMQCRTHCGISKIPTDYFKVWTQPYFDGTATLRGRGEMVFEILTGADMQHVRAVMQRVGERLKVIGIHADLEFFQLESLVSTPEGSSLPYYDKTVAVNMYFTDLLRNYTERKTQTGGYIPRTYSNTK